MEDSSLNSALRCVIYGSGIIVMLGLYGVLQERIMSEPYGGTAYFKVSVFLVLCNRLVAIVYAVSMTWCKGEEYVNKAPLWKYFAVSISNVCATWCQYEALKYVSFPVQMLGKSFKMMPVMLWSVLISQKKYKAIDWIIAAAVTEGVTQFLLTGEISAKHGKKSSSIYGLALLLAFLACDGFTSTFQEKLFKDHKTTKYNQMLYVNSGSAMVSLGTLLVSGKTGEVLSFCSAYPSFMMHASLLSAAAVSGQFFIYSQVKEFGALALAATMNLRQVISILVSYVMYSHPITILQLLGLVVVFGALGYKSYLGFASTSSGTGSKAAPSDPEKQKPSPEVVGKAPADEDELEEIMGSRGAGTPGARG